MAIAISISATPIPHEDVVDGDLAVIESSLILEYLDREFNDSRLMPSDRAGGVAARLWLLRCLVLHEATNSLSISTAHRDRTFVSKSADEIAAMLAKTSDPVKRMKRKDLLEDGVDAIHVQQALQ